MHFVVDTSVFLSDPKTLERLSDKNVVIPLVVVMELEAKRSHPELGYAARETLRTLEGYRKKYSNLTKEFPTGEGGTLIVEQEDIGKSNLPEDFKSDNSNDNKILSVASNLQSNGMDVTLLTQDLPLRLRASIAGIDASEWKEDSSANNCLDLVEAWVTDEDIEDLYRNNSIFIMSLSEYPANTGFILKSNSGSAIGRSNDNGYIRLVKDRSLFDVRGRSAGQRIALDMLSDDNVGIVSLGGPAGTGKSLLAIAAGLEAVMERRTQKKVIVFRPLYAVGGQDLGFLPGTAEEKMSPWAAAVFDSLETVCGSNVIEEVIRRELLEVLPLTHIRGRTLTDTFVIVDECQNLEKMVLLTALTRLGQNSRIVLTHDVSQRDNLRVGKHDGIHAVISKLQGSPLFGHVSLTKSERSPIAQLVADLLEE